MAKKAPIARERGRPRDLKRPVPAARRVASRGAYTLPFQRWQALVFGVGLGVILAGYLALGQGSITTAPLLLVIGYCVFLPLLLIWKGKSEKEKKDGEGM